MKVASEDAIPDVDFPTQVPEVRDDLKPEVGAPEGWTRLDRRICLESHTSHLLRSCETDFDFSSLPVYGTKEHSLKRLLEFEEVAFQKAASQRELEAERDARRQALTEQERSAGEEVDANKATHFRQYRDATIVGCVIETCLRTLSEKAV